MAIKWIVTDMDGTLLDGNDRIMPKTKEYLLECQKHGIKLILASGRSYSRLMPYVKELDLERYGGYLIEVNGIAFNHLKEGKRQVYAQLTPGDSKELFPYLTSLEVEVQAYEDKAIYYWIPGCQVPEKEAERRKRNLPEDYPWLGGAWTWVTDTRNGYPEQTPVARWEELPKRLNKFGCLASPKRMEEVHQAVTKRFGGDYEIVRTCPRLIEIAPKGISKGNTLRRCMEAEQVRPEETIAFGDGENDVGMFRQAAYSVAMGNAEEFVKRQASMVTAGNTEEGIARALGRLIEFLPEIKE